MRVTHDRRSDVLRIEFARYYDGDIAREYMLVEHDVRGDFSFLLNKKGVLLGSRSSSLRACSRRSFWTKPSLSDLYFANPSSALPRPFLSAPLPGSRAGVRC